MMQDKDKFEGFKKNLAEANETQFGCEVRQKYGNESADRSKEKFIGLTEEAYHAMQELDRQIRSTLDRLVQSKANPAGPEGQKVAGLHRDWLCYSWPDYTRQEHMGLVEMYLDGLRFTQYYDKNVPGCAAFLRDAVCTLLKK